MDKHQFYGRPNDRPVALGKFEICGLGRPVHHRSTGLASGNETVHTVVIRNTQHIPGHLWPMVVCSMKRYRRATMTSSVVANQSVVPGILVPLKNFQGVFGGHTGCQSVSPVRLGASTIFTKDSTTLGPSELTIGVPNSPGHMAFTRIPRGRYTGNSTRMDYTVT